MPNALVTGVQSRGGLAVIRSLGAKGIHVTACDSDRIALGFFSRHCHRHFVTPDPQKQPDAFVERILRELRSVRYDVLIPVSDETLPLLSAQREEIRTLTRFPFMPYKALRNAADKGLSVERAAAVGLDVPRTYLAEDEASVEEAVRALGLPVILRPRISRGSEGLYRIERGDAVWPLCREVMAKYGPAIVQEYIPWGGHVFDVDVLMNEQGEVRAAVVCKRIRMYPALAGPTALGQAVDWPELRDGAVRLLESLDWRGPAEVEFRVDPRSGRPVFTEINARFWGSLFTGMIAGVDFPYMLYQIAVEGDCPEAHTCRTDVKARYLFTEDLLCLASHPRKRTIIRSWLGGFFDRNTRVFLFCLSDPVPLLGRILASLVYGARPSRLRERLDRARTVTTT